MDTHSDAKTPKFNHLKFRMRAYFDNQIIAIISIMRRYARKCMVYSKKDCDEIKKMEIEYPPVMTTTDTIKYILKNKCSAARFGDGEFNLCCGKDMSFEKAAGSEELTKRLIEILKTKSNDKILICIPEFNSKFNNTKRVSGKLNFWEYYWFRMFKKLQGFLINDFYGNTNISRNDVFMKISWNS